MPSGYIIANVTVTIAEQCAGHRKLATIAVEMHGADFACAAERLNTQRPSRHARAHR